jgi:CBS domain-containing membrane protein
MYPALLHPGLWFAVQVVLPFTLAAVISAAVMSRLLRSWPRYPAAL